MEEKQNCVLSAVLSTSKVPILVLIIHYCHKKIPQSCIPPVLSVLVELIGNGKEKEDFQQKDLVESYFPSLPQILKLLEGRIEEFFRPQKDKTKVKANIAFICRSILKDLWSLKSYDDFFTFLNSSSALLIDPPTELSVYINNFKHNPGYQKPLKGLHSSSFFGNFISILSIGSYTMTFEEGIKVWNGFVDYRQESEQAWSSFRGLDSSLDVSTSQTFQEGILPKCKVVNDFSKTVVYSHFDLSSLFQSQVNVLQKQAVHTPRSVQNVIASLSQSDRSLLPSSYQVEYLNHWKRANYDESFDSLHRYFDYMMSNRRQYFYHYALSALASLHSSFGANKEALRAIDEAILVARENKDLDYLNYLLTWLLNFMISKPKLFVASTDHPSRSETIQFLRMKTKETKNISLQALSFQFEVAAYDMYFAGEVDEAFNLLHSVEESASKDSLIFKRWKLSLYLLEFYRCLNRCNYSKCSIIKDQMNGLFDIIDDQELSNEIIYQNSLYNLKVGNIEEASKKINEQLLIMRDHQTLFNSYWFIRFQVLYCRVFVENTQYPERAISILLNAINLSRKGTRIFNLCECIICLCKLLFQLGTRESLKDVKELLIEFLPKFLEIRQVSIVSEAYYYLARAFFMELQEKTASQPEENEFRRSRILKYLSISIHGYEMMDDYDSLRKCLEFQKQIALVYELEGLEKETASKLDHLNT
ncbi:Anaphase-promoting complex subunit 5, partial [Pichia kudriavzevii]